MTAAQNSVIHQLVNSTGLVSADGRAGGGEEYSVMTDHYRKL